VKGHGFSRAKLPTLCHSERSRMIRNANHSAKSRNLLSACSAHRLKVRPQARAIKKVRNRSPGALRYLGQTLRRGIFFKCGIVPPRDANLRALSRTDGGFRILRAACRSRCHALASSSESLTPAKPSAKSRRCRLSPQHAGVQGLHQHLCRRFSYIQLHPRFDGNHSP